MVQEVGKQSKNKFYDAYDVARILRVHYNTVFRWGRQGKLPSFKIGGRRYFPAEEIDSYRMYQRELYRLEKP